MVASTRYLPHVIDTTRMRSGETSGPSRPISPSSQRQTAFGFAPGSAAAFRKPCGLSTSSTGKISAISDGTATAGDPTPSRYHACVPFNMNV